MIRLGYKLMTEEHGPKPLVENAVRAEAAGFDFLSISDHFHPWLESQGHAPSRGACSARSRTRPAASASPPRLPARSSAITLP